MPYNGTGTFVRVYNWQTDKANGVKIRADRMDGEDDGFATGLSTAITKDGQTTITANLPMSGFKHTGVGLASARTEYARASQLQDNDLTYFATAGTGSAYTLTPAPAITSLTAGQAFYIACHTVSIGTTPTLQVSGLTAKTLVNSDQTALTSGALKASGIYRVMYDGTNFQLVNRSNTEFADGGEQTAGFTAVSNTRYRARWSTAQTITLPASPTAGDRIQIAYATTAATTLGRNGNLINNQASNLVVDAGYYTDTYTYNATAGWC